MEKLELIHAKINENWAEIGMRSLSRTRLVNISN